MSKSVTSVRRERGAERTATANLARLIARFHRPRLLVIGDLMLDQFIWGNVRRISPEAPVPVVQVTRESAHPGGAGNVVANLAALGERPTVIGWVGGDSTGRRILRLLNGLGADTSAIVMSAEVGSIEKTRIIAHSQQVVRMDRDPPGPSTRLERQLVNRVARVMKGFDAVLVSDYGKGTVSPAMLELLAERHRRDGSFLLIDPKQPNFSHYCGATLVKPNEAEASAAAGIEIRDQASLAAAGARLLERWQSDAVLISRGEHGMALCRPDLAPRHFVTAAREVFDVTGAGDTVMAVLGLALAVGGTLEDAALLANLGAGVVVGKVGTATVSRNELLGAVEGAAARRRTSRALGRAFDRTPNTRPRGVA